MATRTVKSDSGNALKFQNNGGTGSVTITDAGDLTIDSPADIILDAEGADITLKDGGTTYGSLKQASGHLVIQPTSSKEIILNDQAGTASLTVDTASQNVSINNGSIVISTAGQGITFGGDPDTRQNSPTVGDRTLYDYEEGNFTGTLSDGSTNVAMSSDTGYYTKVGNLVTVSGYFSANNLNGLASETIRLTGLPFTVSNNAAAYAGGGAAYGGSLGLAVAGQSVSYFGEVGQSYLQLTVWDATTGTSHMVASEFTASGVIIIDLSYRVA